MMHQESSDLEKGSSDPLPEGPVAARNTNTSVRLWKIAAAVLTVGLLVFAVAFPITRNRNDDTSSVSDNVNSGTNEAPASSPTPSYTSSNGAFNVTLRLFNKDIVSGYSDTKTLEADLSNAAKFLLNNVIIRNTEYGYDGADGTPISTGSPVFNGGMGMPEVAESAPAADQPSDTSAGSNLNDFGQNNQEDDVEEGDVMVSNGAIVFAAYGDEIAAWDAASGTLLTRIQMPPVEVQDTSGNTGLTTEGNVGTDTSSSSTTRSSVLPGSFSFQPYVRHMLIEDGRLMVIVEGYGQMFRDRMVNSEDGSAPVMYDYKATNIRLYDIVSSGEGVLKLHSEKDVNGRFMSVRSISGNAHIVTHSGLDTYTHLVEPFDMYKYPDLTKDEYIAKVTETAGEEAIPKFVSRLMNELKEPTGSMPNLFRLALMQSDVSETNLEEQVFADGAVNSVALVYSFNMLGDNPLGELSLSSSGSFLDSWGTRVYSSDTTMILAGDGWEYDAKSGGSTQSTHLLGVSLNGATSSPGSIGTVEGYFLNSHSLDVVGNVLRVATTIQDMWMIEPMPMMEEEPMEEPSVVESGSSGGGARRLQTDESRTENYIINLDLAASDGEMKEVGRLKLGRPNEVFTSVRFFDNIAYAVTFEQKDPLYALDLSDPANPVILSELNVTGFSSYLHSLNPPENTLLLGMGQEADESGQIVGFQISIFDLADSNEPKLLQRHVVENDVNTYSSSASEWDFMATRIVNGRLIIPLDVDNWEDPSKGFHGFAVFAVSEKGIEEECRIAHDQQYMMYPMVDVAIVDSIVADEPMPGMCYCGNELPRRSMIFNGDLMTTQGSIVKSTDMETCNEVWQLNVTQTNEDNSCCGYIV